MLSNKVLQGLACVVICHLLLAAGCAPEAKKPPQAPPAPAKPAPPAAAQAQPELPRGEPVTLAIKPMVEDTVKYKMTTESLRSIAWEGSVPDKQSFRENRNESRIEMVYTQQIKAASDQNTVAAQITINQLKCFSVVKNETVVDYDSTRQADANNVLSQLIGRGYMIEITGDNHIPTVWDLAEARTVMTGTTPAHQMGLRVFDADIIIEQHELPPLPPPNENRLNVGDTWKRLKTFSFGLMGLKSFDKIYKLTAVKDVAGHKVAEIEMTSLPTAAVESKFLKEKGATELPQMFDTSATYVGSARIDVMAGRIDACREDLNASWVAALPTEGEDPNSEPVILKMTEKRSFNLEKLH